jgi:uncharacterized protein (TIGR02118 family)
VLYDYRVVKLTFCARRLPHLSLEEFQRYWLENHGPLVRERAAALRIRRYMQVHRLDTPLNDAMRASREAADAYDGVAELWWDSVEDLVAGTSSDEGRKAGRELLDDERKFIDLRRSALWIGEEHEVVTG